MRPAGAGGHSRRAASIAAVCSGVALLAFALPATASVRPHAAPPRWILRGSFRPVPTQVLGVSCPSPTNCVAVGQDSSSSGLVLLSSDGGVTWREVPVPVGTGPLASVSCPTTTRCEAAVFEPDGISIISSSDGGETWSPQYVPAAADVGNLETIRCSSSADCVATGSGGNGEATILLTTDGGLDWAQTSPFGVNEEAAINGVWCTTGECMVVGAAAATTEVVGVAAVTTDDGLTWTQLTLPSDVQAIWDVTCTSAEVCIAPGENQAGAGVMLSTSDAGQTWNEATLASGYLPLFVQCPSATVCDATGVAELSLATPPRGLFLQSTDGGATWSSVALPADLAAVDGLSCASASDCVAAASNRNGVPELLDVHGAGAQVAAALATGVTGLYDLSCGARSFCVATGDELTRTSPTGVLLSTRDAGETWGVRSSVFAASFYSVSCADASSCVALGATPFSEHTYVEWTNDGGQTWRTAVTPDGLESVSCAGSTCVAVGPTSVTYRRGARGHWERGSTPKGLSLYEVACATARRCAALGATGPFRSVIAVSDDGGKTWAAPVKLAHVQPTGLQCAPDGTCIATAYAETTGLGRIYVGRADGQGWHAAVAPSSPMLFASAACENATDCVVSGIGTTSAIMLVSHDGEHFGYLARPSGAAQVGTVTCGPSGCWAVAASDTGVLELEALR